MHENKRNPMFLGDIAWQISPEESLGQLQASKRIVISVHFPQVQSNTLSV